MTKSTPWALRVRHLLLILLVLACVVGAKQALAVVQSGTIDFGPSPPSSASAADILGSTGLRLYNTWYTDYDAGGSYSPAPSGAFATTDCTTTCYGTSANPGRLGAVFGYDHFNISTLDLANPGDNSFITITAWRDGFFVDSKTFSVSPGVLRFNTVTLNFTNINELRFFGDGTNGWMNIDNLVVTPNLPTLTLTPAAGTVTGGTIGIAYSQTFTAGGGTSGLPNPYTYAITAGALPAGLSLNTSTGVVSGTPTATGTSSFTVTATDVTTATVSHAYTLTIAPPGINVTPTTLPGGTVATGYSQSFSATGGTSPYIYAIASGGLPAGLALNAGGLLSGTPTAGGAFTFTVKATDSSGGTGPYVGTSSNISLAIAAPTLGFSPASLPAATPGSAYSQQINASGGTAPYGSFTVASGSLPPGLSLGASGVVSGTPTAAGNYSFTVSARDSSTGTGPYSATSGTISVTVNAPNLTLLPASLPNPIRNTAYTQVLTPGGGVAPYAFSVSNGSLPPGLSLATGGTLSGTPTAEGTYNFTVQASDSTGGIGAPFSTLRTYSVTVNPPLPVAGAASATVAYNSSANAIALNLSGGTATSVAVATGAAHGTATASGTSITYTPHAGYSGSDSFTYTATNGTGTSAPATVTITVNPQAPIAGAASATVAFGSSANPITLNLSGGAPASVAVASGPSHGTATASGTSITYTTHAGYSGSDSFTYTAANAGGTSAPATVSITVNPQAPIAGAASATVAFGSSANPITLNLSGGAPASVAVASGASHGMATASGTSITYTPNAGYVGSDSFTYTATNAGGTSSPATVSVTVTGSAELASLGLSAGTLAPTFGSGTTLYTARVAHGVAALRVTAQAVDPAATLQVNGSSLANGGTSGDILLQEGENTIVIEATAQDSTRKAYTVTVTRSGPATFTANAPVGPAGAITATISGGSLCGFDSARFVNAAPGASPSTPPGKALPYGVFDFTASGCGPTATVTLTYPQPLGAGAQYWKYGPTPTRAAPHWYEMPAAFQGQTVSFDITDGGLGDDDFALGANGRIVDAGGVAVAAATGATGIPALTPGMLLSLSATLAALGGALRRRRMG